MYLIEENGEYVLKKEIEGKIIQLQDSINILSEELNGIKAELLQEIEEHIKQEHEINYKKSNVKITYTIPTTKETFDSKKFKSDYPELYNKYIKISDIKSSLRLKIDDK